MFGSIRDIGIRARLILFLGAVLAPLMILLGVNFTLEYHTTIAAAKNDVKRMAETIAAKQSTAFQEAKSFLDTVRQLPDVSAAGGTACHTLLAHLKESHPQFHTIGISDGSQMITCHSKLTMAQQVGDPALFARLSRPEAPEFNVSEFLIGKVSKQPTVIASIRLLPVNGRSLGILFVSMNLEQLLQLKGAEAGGQRTVALIEMPSARLLARYPRLDVPFGTSVAAHPVIRAVQASDVNIPGEAEGIGQDGQDRLFGYAPIEGLGDAKIIAGVGLPRAEVLAAVHHRVITAILGCGSVLVLSCMAAWWIGFWTQLWPIARLRNISQRIACGDFAARATIEPWQAPEFRALGSAFDAMASKLEEGRKAEKAVADSNRCFAITERLAQVGYWQLDLATMRSTWSDEVFRIYGLSPQPEPPSFNTLIETFHPDERYTIEHAFENAIRYGTDFEIPLRLNRWGELRHVLSRGRVERDPDGKVALVYGAFLDITDVKEAELKAQSANAMLTMAEEMAEVGHWRFDLRQVTLTWSEQVYRMHGLDSATHRPSVETAIEFYHPEDRAYVEATVAAAIAGAEDYEFCKRIIRSDGSTRNVISRGRCETDPVSGEVVAIFGVIMDVTALHQAERKLIEKSALLETTLETIDQGLIMVSNDGRLDVSNRRFAELLDLPGAILDVARPDFEDILDYLHDKGEYAATSAEFQRHIRARGEPFSLGVYERRRPNGCILEVRTTALPDDTGMVRTYTDVTDRRKAELALQESEARYRMLVENASDMIFRLDRNFVRTYVSPASADILGFQPEELVGLKPIDMVNAADAAEVTAAYNEVLAGVERTKITNRIRHRDGRWIWVEVELRGIRDPDSREVLEIAGIMRDISERQAQRDLLEAARKEAEEALRVKGEFLAVMSHELRTPLNGIIGFANLLSGRPELAESPASPYVKNIQTASRHLLSIVNDVLDVSKGEAGALQLDPKPFVFRHFVKDTVSVIADEAENKGLVFGVEVDSSIPERLIGDDARLRQVLVNLISNSLKFTAIGHVAFKATLADLTESRATILFRISDSGIGIPKEKLDTLFQRFMQADQTISRRFGGTGLGLSICKDILALMDSQINVRSTLGQGSSFEFTVSFPLVKFDEETLELDTGALTTLASLSILVAEDVPMNQDLLRVLLEQWGHSVEIVSDGVMAVAAVGARAFDIILMDIQMPGMDGVEATRLIRAMEGSAASTPIVALTANVFPEQIEAFLGAGMNGHVAKPFVSRELHTAIETCCRSSIPSPRPSNSDESLPIFMQQTFDELVELMSDKVVKGFLAKLILQIENTVFLPDLKPENIQSIKDKAHSLVSSSGFLGFQRISHVSAQFANTQQEFETKKAAYAHLSQVARETMAIAILKTV